MRKFVWLAVLGMFAIPARGWSQQSGQSSAATHEHQQPRRTLRKLLNQRPSRILSPRQLARHANKEKHRSATTVFTNDNIPSTGDISSVGLAAPPAADNGGATGAF